MLESLGSLDALKDFSRQLACPVVVTRGAYIVAVNDAWLSVLGYRRDQRDQIEGRRYVEFMPPEEQARIVRRMELRSKDPQKVPPARMISIALRADGRSTVVHVEPTVIPTGDGPPFVLNLIFVAPERDEEIELAELLVAASSQLASARTMLDVRRLTVRHLGEGGYSAAFFAPDGTPILPEGARLPDAIQRADLEEALAEGRPVFAGPEGPLPVAVIVPIQRGKGSELLALSGARLSTPLRAALRLFAQGVGSALDTASLIHDLERRNHELSETRADLVRHERLAALGEMAATVAHEVRNPVAVISNVVSTFRRDVLVNPERRALLAIVDEECHRLTRMIQDLLDFSNPRPVSFMAEALSEIAAEAIAAASKQPDPAAHSVRFELECAEGVPNVNVDRHLLRQALVNLLINAAQASPDGGVVRVRVELTTTRGEKAPTISIVDQGSGIAAPVADRIFEPFFTTRPRGTGLGLAVVRRNVEQLSAAIHVEAPQGRGATFVIVFDRERESAAATSGRTSPCQNVK